MKYKKLILFSIGFLTLHQFFVSHAYAYIDPVTGSAVLTLIAGALAAGAMTLKYYWFQIKSKISGDHSQENEADTIDKSDLESGFVSEWAELKKINRLSQDERSIVFYAENKASMNHFQLLIHELTEKTNLQICYVTSVKNDPILSTKNQKILPFYIGDGTARTKFFSSLKARILVTDMPDLGKFHIKRSEEYPVHYIYLFHSMYSVHSYLRKGAVDNYDTIFCVGPHQVKEIREIENVYDLKEKKLIYYGLSLILFINTNTYLKTLYKQFGYTTLFSHNKANKSFHKTSTFSEFSGFLKLSKCPRSSLTERIFNVSVRSSFSKYGSLSSVIRGASFKLFRP